MIPIKQALAELDGELVALVKKALRQQTTSYSSLDNIVTGNAYQSVRLRDAVAAGFRQQDESLFAGVPLKGKRFVDLGANLGEKTRLAALAGAEYAEGIEYEEFFVRTGGLISVYNRTTNAVLRQGDLTQPGCVKDDFDVGACFSAFVYVEKNLEEILSRLRRIFILETHAMDAGWYDQYVRRIEPFMPHWILYGFTDHGAGQEAGSRRALMAFGRDRETVELVAINRCDELAATHRDVRALDVAGSRRAECMWGDARRTKELFREVKESLAALPAPDAEQVAEVLRPAIPRLRELCDAYNLPGTHFGTDRYWLELFEGLVHFVEQGGMTPANPYLRFLRELSASGDYDPGMAYELGEESRAIRRLAPRLERFLEVLGSRRVERPLVMYNPLPVEALGTLGYAPSDPQLDEHVRLEGGGEYRVQFVDGNHRLAALWLSGAERCPVLPVWTNVFGLEKQDYPLFEDAGFQRAHARKLLAQAVLSAPAARAAEPQGWQPALRRETVPEVEAAA